MALEPDFQLFCHLKGSWTDLPPNFLYLNKRVRIGSMRFLSNELAEVVQVCHMNDSFKARLRQERKYWTLNENLVEFDRTCAQFH